MDRDHHVTFTQTSRPQHRDHARRRSMEHAIDPEFAWVTRDASRVESLGGAAQAGGYFLLNTFHGSFTAVPMVSSSTLAV